MKPLSALPYTAPQQNSRSPVLPLSPALPNRRTASGVLKSGSPDGLGFSGIRSDDARDRGTQPCMLIPNRVRYFAGRPQQYCTYIYRYR